MVEVEPLPDGQYIGVGAYIAEDSDFTLDEAVARLRAAFPGREVRALPVRRSAAVARALGVKRMIVFLVEQPQVTDERCRADIQRACEVLSGFRGAWAFDMDQGGVVHQQWRAEPGAAPDRGGT
jgi:hypothetical protein